MASSASRSVATLASSCRKCSTSASVTSASSAGVMRGVRSSAGSPSSAKASNGVSRRRPSEDARFPELLLSEKKRCAPPRTQRRATCLTTARASRNGSAVIRMESTTKNVPIASRTHGAPMSNCGREGGDAEAGMDVSETSSGGDVGKEDMKTRGEHADALIETTRGLSHRRTLPSACVVPRIADSFGKYEPAAAHPRQIRRAPPRTRSAPSAHPSIARAR